MVLLPVVVACLGCEALVSFLVLPLGQRVLPLLALDRVFCVLRGVRCARRISAATAEVLLRNILP